MSTLHLISLPVPLRAFRQWMAGRGLGIDEGRGLHHLLCETFGNGAVQPFRLMVAPRAVNATLYAYTTSAPATLAQTALECAMPETLAICGPERLSVKSMPENWTKGRRLAFDLRARPVRRLIKPAGKFKKGAEVDAFLAKALRLFPDGPPNENRVERESVYLQWLGERLHGAATVTRARVARLRRNRVERDGRTVDGPDVIFRGELEITDAAAFADRLERGIGRHNAYGYGMLLLRPAR